MRFSITSDVIGRSIIVVLTLALIVLVYSVVSVSIPTTKAQGTYEMVQTVDEMWDVSAPCFNSGNCNFSCNAANEGRSCYANICSGLGNGDTAYLDHTEYTCTYFPPASCPSGQIGTPPDCRFPTCADDPTLDGCSCSATNACNESAYGTFSGGNCSVTAPAVTDVCPDDAGLQCTGPCNPPPPTCADSGLLGTYPDCYAPPPPDPTCADYGQLGTYPDCYAPPPPPPPDPTCADSGQLGTYPDCYDAGGGDPAPTATLTANPNPASGNTALTWTSTNATSCTGVGTSFSTGGATSGTDSTVTPGYTYQVQCTGPGGNVTAQVAVGVIGGACPNTGPLNITAAPSRIQPGENVVLSWSAGNIAAASCTVTNLATGDSLATVNATACAVGDQVTPAGTIQAQTTFRLTCGTLTKDVVVNMIPRYEEF